MDQLEYLKNLSAVAVTTCLYCGACALTGAIFRLGDAALFAVTISDIAKATMLFVPFMLIYLGMFLGISRVGAQKTGSDRRLIYLSIFVYAVLSVWSVWEGVFDLVAYSVFPIISYINYGIRRLKANGWVLDTDRLSLLHVVAGCGLLSFYTGWGFRRFEYYEHI